MCGHIFVHCLELLIWLLLNLFVLSLQVVVVVVAFPLHYILSIEFDARTSSARYALTLKLIKFKSSYDVNISCVRLSFHGLLTF